jgi:tRNA threonylcarbamoyladenosine biosynthesis protein TsaB
MTWPSGQNHSVELVPNILHLLQQAKKSLQQIDAIIVAKGPGSFNGLRVGVGTAKGLAFALGKPLVGIGTLEVEAFPHALTGLPICPLQDAARGELATALYQFQEGEWRQLIEEHITTVDELWPKIINRTLFCGRIPPYAAQELKERLGERALILKSTLRRAGFLAELGWRRLDKGEIDNPTTLQPLYLRRPAVTTKRKTKR